MKSEWIFLGQIGIDSFNDYGNTIIITDSENFPKYFDPRHYYTMMNENDYEKTNSLRKHRYPHRKDLRKVDGVETKNLDSRGMIDLLNHEEYLEIGEYNSYSIPWRNDNDQRASLWGRYIGDKILDVLIYHDDPNNLNYGIDFNVIETKKCSINIYSGYIGIDEPLGFKENELLESSYKFKCPIENAKYEVLEVNINYPKINKDNILLGTLININKNYILQGEEIKDLMNKIYKFKKEK